MQAVKQHPPAILLALAIAVAAHAALLFGIALPALRAEPATLHVTLSGEPGQPAHATRTLAATTQTGKAKRTQHQRDRTPTTAQAGTSAAPAQTARPTGNGNNTARPVLTQTQGQHPEAARDGGRQAASAAPRTRGNAAQDTTRSAHADLRAAYLDAWRRTVEQVGNREFPAAALAGGQPDALTLQVSVAADGRLRGTRILHSSGNPALDAAAQRILHAAAPFAAFPPALRKDNPQLTFAYNWRFLPQDAH